MILEKINSHPEILKDLVYKSSDLKSVAKFIIGHPSCEPVINKIYTELALGRKISEYPASFRAMLSLLSGSSLMFREDYIQSFNCFREALYTYPIESTMDAIILLIEGGRHTSALIDTFLEQIKLGELVVPTAHQYANCLKSNPNLRIVIKYERSVQAQNLSHFKKAMLYIDLCMACAHPQALSNNLILASAYLLDCILDQMSDPRTLRIRKHHHRA